MNQGYVRNNTQRRAKSSILRLERIHSYMTELEEMPLEEHGIDERPIAAVLEGTEILRGLLLSWLASMYVQSNADLSWADEYGVVPLDEVRYPVFAGGE